MNDQALFKQRPFAARFVVQRADGSVWAVWACSPDAMTTVGVTIDGTEHTVVSPTMVPLVGPGAHEVRDIWVGARPEKGAMT